MWAVTMYSIGELTGAFAAPTLIRLLSFRYAIFLGAVTSPLGFLFYSGAPSAWFILIARFFIGVNCGTLTTIIPTYLSETSTFVYLKQKELELQEQETSNMKIDQNSNENPVKDRVFAVHIFAMSSSFIIAQGKYSDNYYSWQNAITCQFTSIVLRSHHVSCTISKLATITLPISLIVCPSPLSNTTAINSVTSRITWINPYRFPGWFVIATSAVVLTAYLLLFNPYKPEKALNCKSIFPCGRRALCIPQHRGQLETPSIRSDINYGRIAVSNPKQ